MGSLNHMLPIDANYGGARAGHCDTLNGPRDASTDFPPHHKDQLTPRTTHHITRNILGPRFSLHHPRRRIHHGYILSIVFVPVISTVIVSQPVCQEQAHRTPSNHSLGLKDR